jgi:hypothetical protein
MPIPTCCSPSAETNTRRTTPGCTRKPAQIGADIHLGDTSDRVWTGCIDGGTEDGLITPAMGTQLQQAVEDGTPSRESQRGNVTVTSQERCTCRRLFPGYEAVVPWVCAGRGGAGTSWHPNGSSHTTSGTSSEGDSPAAHQTRREKSHARWSQEPPHLTSHTHTTHHHHRHPHPHHSRCCGWAPATAPWALAGLGRPPCTPSRPQATDPPATPDVVVMTELGAQNGTTSDPLATRGAGAATHRAEPIPGAAMETREDAPKKTQHRQ